MAKDYRRIVAGEDKSKTLLQSQARNLHGGRRLIPLRRHAVICELKIALLTGSEGNGRGAKKPLLISKDDLLKDVVELERDLDLPNASVPIICCRPEHERSLLI
jgi:hypothetical protein